MKRRMMARRSCVWTACLMVLALVWGYASLCAGQNGQNVESDELKDRIRAMETELKQLHESEDAPAAYKEYTELKKQRNEMGQRHYEKLRESDERMRDLSDKQDVKEWRKKVAEKASELNRLRQMLQSEIHKHGQELHERRRAELAGVAVAEAEKARTLGFTALSYPRVDGSTSTQPLGMIIACKMLGSSYRWAGTAPYAGRWYTGEDSIDPMSVMPFASGPAGAPEWGYAWSLGSGQFSLVGYRPIAEQSNPESTEEARLSVMINRMLTIHAGTHGAYENVINGKSDIGLVARRPSADELELANKTGVELDVEPFALDAFVFIANYKNPVSNLTTEQIRSIYSGKVTNWNEVGGPKKEINAYQRNRNSGSQELMEKLVMKDLPFSKPEHGRAQMLIHQGMGGPYIALTHDESGLGYSVYYYEHFMAGSPDTKLMAVDGVLPSFDTIRARQYPYATEVYVVTRKGLQSDSGPAKLRAWLLSDEGQAVVRESGYVPLAE